MNFYTIFDFIAKAPNYSGLLILNFVGVRGMKKSEKLERVWHFQKLRKYSELRFTFN